MTTLHEVLSLTGRHLGWAKRERDGAITLVTPSGIDLLAVVSTMDQARNVLEAHADRVETSVVA